MNPSKALLIFLAFVFIQSKNIAQTPIQQDSTAAAKMMEEAKELFYLEEYDKALETAHQGYIKFDSIYGDQSIVTLDARKMHKSLKLFSFKFDETPDDYYEIYDKYVELCGIDSLKTINALSDIGNYYSFQAHYNEGLDIYQKCIKQIEESPKFKTEDRLLSLSKFYNNCAITSRRLGNLGDVIFNFEKCKVIREKIFGPNHYMVTKLMVNMAGAYTFIQEYDKSIDIYKDMIVAYESDAKYESLKSVCYYGLATCYNYLNVPDSVAYYTNKGLEVIERFNKYEAAEYPQLLIAKAYNLAHFEKYDEGRIYLKRLQKYVKEKFPKEHPRYLELQIQSGEYDMFDGNYIDARAYFEEVIDLNLYSYDNVDDFSRVVNPRYFIQALERLAYSYDRHYDKGDDSYVKAEKYYNIGLDFIKDYFVKKGPLTQSVITNEKYYFHWKAAFCKYRLGKLEESIQIIESNKAQTILGEILKEEVVFHNIPTSIIDSLKSTTKKVANWQQKVFKAEDESDEKLTAYSDTLVTHQTNLKKQQSYIKQTYPEYNELVNPQLEYNIADLQQVLNENEAIIQIEHIDTAALTFVTHQNGYAIQHSSWANGLDSLQYFKDQLKSNEIQDYIDSISIKIVHPVLRELPEHIDHLIFICNGVLSYFPFEMMTDDNGESLIYHYDVSYESSSNIFILNHGKSKKIRSAKVALFAPEYADISGQDVAFVPDYIQTLVRDGTYNLPGAKVESEMIADIVDGDLFTDTTATKYNFIKQAENYHIYHLAMHSNIHDDHLKSSLLFSPENIKESSYDALKVYELYNLKFNADLVVLSACNTGFGKSKRGEGIMSLSRAFAYAGVGSILHSLWKVPDQATSHIMVNFYQNLKEGKSKDKALRQAKLSYLNDESIPSTQKKPYYWAGFIATGNMDEVEFDSPYASYYWFIGLGLLIIGLFTLCRKRERV